MNETKLIAFDLERAKTGDDVITRDGRNARIVCFDRKSKGGSVIVALIDNDNGHESQASFNLAGRYHINNLPSCNDLFMKPKKLTLWMKVVDGFGFEKNL